MNGSNGAINPVIWDGSCVDYDVTDANDDSLESLKLLVDSNDDGAPDNSRLDYNTARTGAEAGCMYNRLVRDMSTTGDDVIVGLSGNDWINGRAGNDSINGSYGDDVIYGGAGSDTLDGGLGSRDYLSGGESGDTYLIHPDSYEETISDKDTTVSGTETDGVNFVEGTTANQLWFYLDDTDVDGTVDDLVIQNIASGTKVMIENWTNTVNQIENIATQNGACTALSYSAISGLLTIMPSKATPPTVNFLDAALAPYWSGTGC